jgi:hypothetical protein
MAAAAAAAAGTFWVVRRETGCQWDPYTEMVHQVVGTTDANGHWHVSTKKGGKILVHPRDIIRPVAPVRVTYPVDTKVEVVVHYHQLAGETFGEGTVVNASVWGTDVTYTVRLTDGTTRTFEQHAVRRRLPAFTPPPPSREEILRAEEARLLAQLAAIRSQMSRS